MKLLFALLSIFAGGAFLVPALPIAGAVISFVKAAKVAKAGIEGSDEKLSFTETVAFKYGVGFTIAAILILAKMIADK